MEKKISNSLVLLYNVSRRAGIGNISGSTDHHTHHHERAPPSRQTYQAEVTHGGPGGAGGKSEAGRQAGRAYRGT